MELMLSRDEIERECLSYENHGAARTVRICQMALALLDVAELVPGEGDVVERVRKRIESGDVPGTEAGTGDPEGRTVADSTSAAAWPLQQQRRVALATVDAVKLRLLGLADDLSGDELYVLTRLHQEIESGDVPGMEGK